MMGYHNGNVPDARDRADGESRRGRTLLNRFLKRKEGAAAIEFALLSIPFFIILFATVETFIAFAGEQLLANANETLARKIRTGEITFEQGKSTDMKKVEFRAAFCAEIAILMTCSQTEAATPDKLYIDVRSFSSFDDIPISIPRVGSADSSDLDISSFDFAPGGAGTINIVRAYYRWEIITDLVRPYITNLRPAGQSMPSDYLMVATAVIRNENYP